jgi:hypothetical protein
MCQYIRTVVFKLYSAQLHRPGTDCQIFYKYFWFSFTFTWVLIAQLVKWPARSYKLGLRYWHYQGNFSVHQHMGMKPTKCHIQQVLPLISLEAKFTECETDHSPPSSVNVYNALSFTSTFFKHLHSTAWHRGYSTPILIFGQAISYHV